MRAAIAIAQTNPRLSIAVVSKVYPMRSHTVSAEGGAAGVHSPDDSLDEHAYDTISGGDWLCDQDAVEALGACVPFLALNMRRRAPWPEPPAMIADPSLVTSTLYASSSTKNSPIFVRFARSTLAKYDWYGPKL